MGGDAAPHPAALLTASVEGTPQKTKRFFSPRVHAFRKEIRKAMYEAYALFLAAFREAAEKLVRQELWAAYAWFVAAFREASAKLRAGDRLARFPAGSFPPALPFVAG